MNPDRIGWIATGLMALGSIEIAHQNVTGLWLMALSNLLFGWMGYKTKLSSLVAVSLIMCVLDLYGVYQWSK